MRLFPPPRKNQKRGIGHKERKEHKEKRCKNFGNRVSRPKSRTKQLLYARCAMCLAIRSLNRLKLSDKHTRGCGDGRSEERPEIQIVSEHNIATLSSPLHKLSSRFVRPCFRVFIISIYVLLDDPLGHALPRRLVLHVEMNGAPAVEGMSSMMLSGLAAKPSNKSVN